MADYDFTAPEPGVTPEMAMHAITLTEDEEDTVSLHRYEGEAAILVHPGGSVPVYLTNDGTEATVAGANTHVVWPGYAVYLRSQLSGNIVIRLISEGAATYSIEAG